MKPEIEIFRDYVRKKRLRNTPERELIIEEIFSSQNHFDIDELYLRLREKNQKVSKASIYRTIPLLIESGLVQEVFFEDGHLHYEHIHGREHHCHLHCLNCRKIVEFQDRHLESIEKRLGRKFNFDIISHKLEVYGYCEECRKDKRGR